MKLETDIAAILEELEDRQFSIELPESTPNVRAREGVRMTDAGPIVRTAGSGERGTGELVNRRWR